MVSAKLCLGPDGSTVEVVRTLVRFLKDQVKLLLNRKIRWPLQVNKLALFQ